MRRAIESARPLPSSWGRAAAKALAARNGHHHFTPKLLVVHKRGRDCAIAKIVFAKPLAEIVVGMPFRNRPQVQHVSLPPAVLEFARQQGARWWLVRLDNEGVCLRFPLAQVEAVGWLKTSEGKPEFFIPLSRFELIPWQDWDWVEEVHRFDASPEEPTPVPRQLPLALEVG